jgi:hypothetical protein
VPAKLFMKKHEVLSSWASYFDSLMIMVVYAGFRTGFNTWWLSFNMVLLACFEA